MSKILIIEDEKLLCQLYGSVLGNAKHKVALTYNGEDGIASALNDRPDLVIMDLNLPGLSGAEAAGQLRKCGILPATPMIVATALGEEARSIANSLDAVALLPKPFHLKTLLAVVENALAGDPQEAPVA